MITIVTDGTPTAAALAAWLRQPGTRQVEARDADDARQILTLRQGLSERVLGLVHATELGQIDGREALDVVTRWLSELSPFDARTQGPRRITEQLAIHAPGAEAVRKLAAMVVPARARTGKVGRPPGGNPFRGLGLEIVTTLLLEPGRTWAERSLASNLERSAYGVHRALAELHRRGYLMRSRGQTRVRDTALLRDDLAADWRGRMGLNRPARVYLSARTRTALSDIAEAADRMGRALRLGAGSAVAGPEAPSGGPHTIYLEGDPDEVMLRAGSTPSAGGDVVVWPIVESAILIAPRQLRGLPATNKVITYADLMTTPTDRLTTAARAVWGEE